MLNPSADRNTPAPSAASELSAWLDAVGEIARAVNRSLPLGELLDLIAATTCRLTGYDFCAVLLEDPDTESLHIEGAFGLSPAYVAEINARSPILIRPGALGEGPSSRAFRSQRPVALLDIHDDATCLPWEGVASEQGYSSILSVPLVVAHAPVGLLNCYTAQPHPFTAQEIILMETIANQAAVAIESTHLRARERSRITELTRLNETLQEQRTALQRAEEVHRRLMRVLLDGADLADVATTLAETMRCQIIVENEGGTMLATSAEQPESGALLHGDEAESLIAEAMAQRRTVEVPPAGGGTAHPSLLTPIVLEGEVAGRIWACGPQVAFTSFDRRSFERGAVVVALAMMRTRTAQEVEWRLSRDVVDELLADEGKTSEGLVERARQLGVDLATPNAVVVIRADVNATPDRVVRLPDEGRTRRALLSTVQRCAERTGVETLVAARGDHVVILWPEGEARPDLHAFAEALRREVRAYATNWTASVAMGPSCSHVSEYADAYELARGALDLVQETGRTNQVVTLDDLGVFRLLLQVKRPAEVARFAHSVLGPLHEYDQRREGTLVPTLRAYMDAQCNSVEAAAALNVHVNTIAYRLRRVQELLDIDLRSPATLVKVEFAFMIERILGRPDDDGA